MADPWLFLSELRQQPWCGRSLDTIRRHVREGTLPAEKDPISRRWRVRTSVAQRVYTGAPVIADPKAIARKIHSQTATS